MIETFTIIFGFVAFISTLKEIKNKYFIFWSLTLLLIFFDGLRWEVGVDWLTYHKIFMTADIYKFQGFEPGYLFYQSIIRKFTDNYSVFLLITTAFIYLTIYYTVFKITNYSFISLFYLTATIPWYSGSLRNMIAVSFFTLAIKAIFDKKMLKFLFFIITGILFHTSLIAFLPIYWLYNFSVILYLLIFIALSVGSIYSSYLIETLDQIVKFYGYNRSYSRYVGGNILQSNPLLGFTRKLITITGLLFFTFLATKFKNKEIIPWEKIKFIFFISSLSIIFYYIGTYQISNVSSRLDIYAGIISTSILIGFIDKLYSKRSNRFFLFLFVTFLVCVFYYRLEHMSLFHPYSSIFYNFDYKRNLF